MPEKLILNHAHAVNLREITWALNIADRTT